MTKKRKYGTGSVYQRSSDNCWVASYRVYENGLPKRRTFTSKVREEVEAWLEENCPERGTDPRPYWQLEREAGSYGTTVSQDNLAKLRAQDGKCVYCERRLNAGWEMDHRLPLTRGGTNEPDNLAICCTHCNRAKGNRTPEEFVEWADATGFFRSLAPIPAKDNARSRMVRHVTK